MLTTTAHPTGRLAAALAALPLLSAWAAPALAAPAAVVYQGEFTHVTAEGCSPRTPDWDVSGGWRFVDKGDVATVSFTIFLDGRHHVSFGGPVEQSGALTVGFPTGAGDLTVTVDPDAGEMEYAFLDGYTALDGTFTCQSLTYHGTVR